MQIDHENISASFRSKIYSSPLTAAVHLFYLRVFRDNLSSLRLSSLSFYYLFPRVDAQKDRRYRHRSIMYRALNIY